MKIPMKNNPFNITICYVLHVTIFLFKSAYSKYIVTIIFEYWNKYQIWIIENAILHKKDCMLQKYITPFQIKKDEVRR